MAVSCTPADLAEAAKCYCYEPGEREKVKTYLLAVIAGLDNLTPKQLADAAACYCYDQNQGKAVNTYLLCQAANGGDGSCEALEGANSPEGAVTPDFIGQLYHETGDDTYWRSTGLTNADWVEISSECIFSTTPTDAAQYVGLFSYVDIPEILTATFNAETTTNGFDFGYLSNITSISFPNLLTVDPANVAGGYLTINAMPSLTSVSLPLLQTVEAGLRVDDCDSLTSLNFPSLTTVQTMTFRFNALLASLTANALVTCEEAFAGNDNAALTTVSFASWLPTNSKAISFATCALNAASVNHILARCVASAGYVSGTITLSGGTNAAPSGQGIVDKATLIGRGCTVNTN